MMQMNRITFTCREMGDIICIEIFFNYKSQQLLRLLRVR